jgi:hypothetical protein
VKFQTDILLTHHPTIHPEDAARAFAVWFRRTAKGRSKATPQAILETFFLAGIANSEWSESEIKTIAELSGNAGFRERFARAMEQGKAPIFDTIDKFILSNWRTLTDPEFAKSLPGLCDWSPRAACDLIGFAGLDIPSKEGKDGSPEEWFTTRRKRLGLRGKTKYRVRSLRRLANGLVKIEHD